MNISHRPLLLMLAVMLLSAALFVGCGTKEKPPLAETTFPEESRVQEDDRGKREYDAWGRLIRETEYEQQSVITVREYAYDEAGHLIYERSCNADGTLENSVEYEYDASGRLSARYNHHNGTFHNKTVYTYDSAGKLLTEVTNNSGGNLIQKKEYVYAEDGSIREISYTFSDGAGYTEVYALLDDRNYAVDTWEAGQLRYRDVYKTDGSGHILKREHYTADGKLETWWEYGYDAAGTLISTVQYNADGEKID